VELNSALPLGGLTPSYGTVRQSLPAGIPVFVMIRPRAGGFAYTDSEFDCMAQDARQLLAMGARGIVFGILKRDGTVDTESCARLMSLSGFPPCVFHRAFDIAPDWKRSVDQLVDLGFCRILTSGQKATAIEGKRTLREMVAYAKDRIEIMPGGGIRPGNVAELVRQTGCRSVHASLRRELRDVSMNGAAVSFFDIPRSEESNHQTDPRLVAKMLQTLRGPTAPENLPLEEYAHFRE